MFTWYPIRLTNAFISGKLCCDAAGPALRMDSIVAALLCKELRALIASYCFQRYAANIHDYTWYDLVDDGEIIRRSMKTLKKKDLETPFHIYEVCDGKTYLTYVCRRNFILNDVHRIGQEFAELAEGYWWKLAALTFVLCSHLSNHRLNIFVSLKPNHTNSLHSPLVPLDCL